MLVRLAVMVFNQHFSSHRATTISVEDLVSYEGLGLLSIKEQCRPTGAFGFGPTGFVEVSSERLMWLDLKRVLVVVSPGHTGLDPPNPLWCLE